MLHNDECRTDLGTVRIHDNVIASIASLAASEIEGVKAIGKSFSSGILEFIEKRQSLAISIEKNKFQEITIHIPLVIKYGYSIPEIASKVQENVKNNLEKMTNISIKDINITIQSVERGG